MRVSKLKRMGLPAVATLLLVGVGSSRAMTVNYSVLNQGTNYRPTQTEPTFPTTTNLFPLVSLSSPSAGFRDAMVSSVAAADWIELDNPTKPIQSFDFDGTANGVLYVDVYQAIAEDRFGRANFQVRYQRNTNPGLVDPDVSNLFWIQTVTTTRKGSGVPGNETNPYVDVYASSYAAGGKLPFYYRPDETTLDNNGVSAGEPIKSGTINTPSVGLTYDLAFTDQPGRAIFNTWQGELFLASYDTTAKSVTVLDGISWGFVVVPEPSSLMIFGSFGVLLMRRIVR